MNMPKVRSDCKYNQDELDKILPFKMDFISSTTEERMALLKKKILPEMFNYWQDLGKEYDAKESKILSKVHEKLKFLKIKLNCLLMPVHRQELTQWCTNNWRMVHGHRKPKKFRTRRIDVLWKTNQELVEREMTRLRNEDGRTSPPFQLRTTASKNILEKMTEPELKILQEAMEQMG